MGTDFRLESPLMADGDLGISKASERRRCYRSQDLAKWRGRGERLTMDFATRLNGPSAFSIYFLGFLRTKEYYLSGWGPCHPRAQGGRPVCQAYGPGLGAMYDIIGPSSLAPSSGPIMCCSPLAKLSRRLRSGRGYVNFITCGAVAMRGGGCLTLVATWPECHVSRLVALPGWSSGLQIFDCVVSHYPHLIWCPPLFSM